MLKYKYGVLRIINVHLEYRWNVNGVKKMLKMSEEIGDVGQKEGSGRTKSLRTEKNIKPVRELILSQEDLPETHSTSAEIAREINTDCQSLSCINDEDLDLNLLRKLKVHKLTDSTIKKAMTRSRKLLSKYTHRTLQTAFFSNGKIFKFK